MPKTRKRKHEKEANKSVKVSKLDKNMAPSSASLNLELSKNFSPSRNNM